MLTVPSTLRARPLISAMAVGLSVLVVLATLLPAAAARAQSAPYNRGIDQACAAESKAFDPFVDTPAGTHSDAVRCVAHFGISQGSVDRNGHFQYLPSDTVSREQMASFIARKMNRVDGFNLPVHPPRAFPDSTGAHARNIDRLAAAGVVEGGPDGRFNRAGAVTREQMASFVSRAIEHISVDTLSPTDIFADNGIARAHDTNVGKLAAVGVVQGRTTGDYSPRARVTREEMASFLARTLDYLADRGHQLTREPTDDLVQAAEGFDWPTCGRVSSEYGPRWGRIHHGIDVAAPTGTPIYASRTGKVTFVGWDGGYGNIVRVDHGRGISTGYAHMSRFGTRVGAKVSRGDVVGYVGSTGNSTGPHLHFEIRTDGSSINPRHHLVGGPSLC